MIKKVIKFFKDFWWLIGCREEIELRHKVASNGISDVKRLLCQHAEAANLNWSKMYNETGIDFEFSGYTIFLVDYRKGQPLIYDFFHGDGLKRTTLDKYYP